MADIRSEIIRAPGKRKAPVDVFAAINQIGLRAAIAATCVGAGMNLVAWSIHAHRDPIAFLVTTSFFGAFFAITETKVRGLPRKNKQTGALYRALNNELKNLAPHLQKILALVPIAERQRLYRYHRIVVKWCQTAF
jgi:hypothetical protein